MNGVLTLAGEEFPIDRAQEVITGYCFGEIDSQPHPPTGKPYGPIIQPRRRRRWGYLSYDCQRGTGPAPDIVDVVAPVLLNVAQGYGVRLVSDLLAIAPMVRDVVASIGNKEFCFWDLDPNEVIPRGMPAEGSPSLALHRAWYLVESVKGADVAVTHKLLHHAWPHLFPLIDNRTASKLGEGYWVTILEDLKNHRSEFADLEDWFEELAQEIGGVRLTRLRLHDILLWCRVTGEEEEAAKAGRDLVGPS